MFKLAYNRFPTVIFKIKQIFYITVISRSKGWTKAPNRQKYKD